jgi:hypothetical protein
MDILLNFDAGAENGDNLLLQVDDLARFALKLIFWYSLGQKQRWYHYVLWR